MLHKTCWKCSHTSSELVNCAPLLSPPLPRCGDANGADAAARDADARCGDGSFVFRGGGSPFAAASNAAAN